MYDYAGEWTFALASRPKAAWEGIVGVVPGQFGIGIFSPLLDAKGNSVRGVATCRELSERFGMHCFETGFDGMRLT